MASVAGEMHRYPGSTTMQDTVVSRVKVPIGGSGAIGTLVKDDPGFTVTRVTNGEWTLAYPAAGTVDISVRSIYSNARTVVGGVVTDQAATSGTATIKILNASGTATDPASGDYVVLEFVSQWGPGTY